MRSNNGKANGKKNKSQHKSEWKQCSLFLSFNQEEARMKTKSNDLSFIHGPFEGRFNPNPSLSLFAL